MDVSANYEEKQLVIHVTPEETAVIHAGRVVVDRHSALGVAANIEIRPLVDINPNYRPLPDSDMLAMSRRHILASEALILANHQIIIYVPRESVSLSNATEELITYPRLQGTEKIVPPGGIRIEFSGPESV